MKNRISGVFIFLLVLFTVSCDFSRSQSARVPHDVMQHIMRDGEYDPKYVKIVRHFINRGDSLEIKACYFIIKNLKGLYTVDPHGGALSFDWDNLSEEQIINNIENAVKFSKKDIMLGSLDFSDFCEYVLPYRLDNESLYNWRSDVRSILKEPLDSLKRIGKFDFFTFCNVINLKLNHKFQFLPGGNNAQIKNFRELFNEQRGNCVEMSKMAVFACRAYGYPVTRDFVPFWGNLNGGGHEWNVFVRSGKKRFVFMGLESGPETYDPCIIIKNQKDSTKTTFRKSGKVYRLGYSFRTFGNDTININDPGYQFIDNFFGDRVKDVTDEYFKVGDYEYKVNDSLKKEHIPIFIGVYQSGQWAPISWSSIDGNGYANFKKLALNVMYIPLVLSGNKFSPVGDPFYLDEEKSTIICKRNDNFIRKMNVPFLQSVEADQIDLISKIGWDDKRFSARMDSVANNFNRLVPTPGKVYSLFYWKMGWRKLQERVCAKSGLCFTDIPYGTIYKVTENGNLNKKERFFTYFKDRQTWY